MTLLEQVVQNSPRLRPRTKARYLKAVKEFLAFAGTEPKDWTPMAVQDYYAKLCARMRPQSANAQIVALRYASGRLARLHANPALDFAAPIELAKSGPEQKREALHVTQVRTLLHGAIHPLNLAPPRGIDLRDYAIMHLAFTTGMRRFSLAGIMIGAVKWDGRRSCFAVPIELKGGKIHEVPLSQRTAQALDAWTRWLATQGVTTGPLFRSLGRARIEGESTVGGRLTEDGFYKLLQKRADAAGLAKGSVFPHICRHTFVTWCKEQGLPNEEIAAVTGHKLPGASSTIEREYLDYSLFGYKAVEAISKILEG